MAAFLILTAAMLLGLAGLCWLADLPAAHDWLTTGDDDEL